MLKWLLSLKVKHQMLIISIFGILVGGALLETLVFPHMKTRLSQLETPQLAPEVFGEFVKMAWLALALISAVTWGLLYLWGRVFVCQPSQQENSARLIHTTKLASLGEMSAGVAHEINNPLAVISGSLSLLQKFRLDEEKFNKKIDVLFKSVYRIEKIVKGLKKFSRTASENVFRSVPLNEIIEEAMIFVEVKSKINITPIEIQVPRDILITCDPVEIEQVLVNMINNAVDAVKGLENRWVKLIAFQSEERVLLQIQDSGPGISTEIEMKLFDPFFTTKPAGEGTGLGLSIAKGILDQHKATIRLNREFANTCFEISFPTSLENEEEKSAA